MKILLSTIVDNTNIGTYLQIFATVRKLEIRGHDVTVLNYVRDYLFGRQYALNLWKNRPFLIRHILSFAYAIRNKFVKNQTKQYLNRTGIKLTKRYGSLDEIKKHQLDFDLFVSGSDQIWNCTHNNGLDEVFFLSFTNGKKVAYAASIGTDNIPPEFISRFKKLLYDYRCISVREDIGVEMLNRIGIKDVINVLDPTLLLKQNEWISSVPTSSFTKTENYLLIYTVEQKNQELLYAVADKISKNLNLKVYQISSSYIRNKNTIVNSYFETATPELFIQLFYNASYTIVSSFHGTAFSINFGKQFITVSPDRFSSRVLSLLRLFNIENRYVNNFQNIPNEDIPYDLVHEKLELMRKKSEDYIDHMLNS